MENELENEAALDETEQFTYDSDDQELEETSEEIEQTESAPVEEETSNVETEKPESKGFQDRIDKVTADKYAEKRRADELQSKLDAIEAERTKEAIKKPSLDDPAIDYDEEAFDKANREYEVKLGVQAALDKKAEDAKQALQNEESEKVQSTFNERAAALGKADFQQKAAAIPVLDGSVVDAIMRSELGAEMVYHLGENPDKAASIASMTPALALMELGKLSTKLATKPEIKTSAAPEPIESLRSGSSMAKERGPTGATYS